jgi:hypothetical protein
VTIIQLKELRITKCLLVHHHQLGILFHSKQQLYDHTPDAGLTSDFTVLQQPTSMMSQ